MSRVKLANSIINRAVTALRGSKVLPTIGTGAAAGGVGYGSGKLVGGLVQQVAF
jgi:hypothetical protein